MSEAQNKPAQQADDQQPQFALQRIYIKDLSFESPKAPGIFKGQWQPEVNLDLNTSNTQLQEDGMFEVVLSLTATVKHGEEVAFVAEVQQAGIFLISGMNEADLHRTLGAFCPNLLFPYARETIDSLVTRGSFPALMLAPVNFDALYAQAMQQAAEQAADQTQQ